MAGSSGNAKIPFVYKVLYLLNPIIEKTLPPLAKYLGAKLFFTPIRFPVSKDEINFRAQAKITFFKYHYEQIAQYQWGNPEHPIVIIMHGWSSRASQFRSITQALLDLNYCVVAVDAPGHGLSTGIETTVIEFSDVLEVVLKQYPNHQAVIAHSLGGAAALKASANYKINNLLLLAIPCIADEIITAYVQRVNAGKNTGIGIAQKVQRITGKSLEHFTAIAYAEKAQYNAILAWYDTKDYDAPVHHGEALCEKLKNPQFLVTKEYGHFKLIKQKQIADVCHALINKLPIVVN